MRRPGAGLRLIGASTRLAGVIGSPVRHSLSPVILNTAFQASGVDWVFLKPYIVLGLALGGVYALSGVGIVVLYQATGVLNLAFGAVGAAGALIAYWMINHTSWPDWLAYATCVAFGGVVNLLYGVVFGPAFAHSSATVRNRCTPSVPITHGCGCPAPRFASAACFGA